MRFHAQCIGANSSRDGRFLDYPSLLAVAGLHNEAPTMLKMDVEGFEWGVLRGLLHAGQRSARVRAQLPLQIAFELHVQGHKPPEVARLMDDLWRLGNYFIAKRDDNPYCIDYTELLLVSTKLLASSHRRRTKHSLIHAPSPPNSSALLHFVPGPASLTP